MQKCVVASAAILMMAAIAHAELPSASDATIRQSLASGRPTVIELGARSCPSCKKMAPIIESISKELHGKAEVLFVDVQKDEDAADKFRVQMIPTQIFFNAQGKEVKRHVGFFDKPAVINELKAAGLK